MVNVRTNPAVNMVTSSSPTATGLAPIAEVALSEPFAGSKRLVIERTHINDLAGFLPRE